MHVLTNFGKNQKYLGTFGPDLENFYQFSSEKMPNFRTSRANNRKKFSTVMLGDGGIPRKVFFC